MIEMKVLGLALDNGTKAPILVLKALESEEVLPLWIGGVEAMSISLALNNTQAERPLTHDLLFSILRGLNVTVAGVSIIDVREGIFYGMLDLVHGDRLVSIDCRPSDGVALAVRVQAPIRVAEAVLKRAPLERYITAVSGQTFAPDETGNIVRRSLQQVEQLLNDAARSKDEKENAEQGKTSPFGPTVGETTTPSLSVSGLGSPPASEEDELFSKMLRELEPASKNRM